MGASEPSVNLHGTPTFATHPNVETSNNSKLVRAILGPILVASAIVSLVVYGQYFYAPPLQRTIRLSSSPEGGITALYPNSAAAISAASGGFSLNALVSSICKHTAYPDVCARELSGFRIPLTANPLEIVSFAVQAAARRVSEAQTLAINCSGQKGLSLLEEQCANDCVELLYGAKDQMDLVAVRLSSLRGLINVATLRKALADVKVWISSSLSYQTACSDNFQVAPGSIQHQIQTNQAYLTRVLGVALGLIDALAQVGNSLDSWLGAVPSSFRSTHLRRRLLNHHHSSNIDGFLDSEEGDGFPKWVSAAEGRLLQASPSAIAANAIVAKDGSGKYTTVTAAVNAIPSSFSGRYVIYIKKGVYNEVLNVTKNQKNVTFVGDGIDKTIITGDRNVASGDYNTYRTSTVGISGSGFFGRDLTFRNTAGPSGHQAVAVRAGADYIVFYRCSFEGYQDTLYALSSRQYYRECQIYGTVDYIFGNAIAVFQNCGLVARLPMKGQQNTYTAHGRQLEADVSGYSFHNCTLKADPNLTKANYTVETYLGRPWKAYSRTVFIQSELQALVQPQGWLPWNASNPFTDTVYYGEYGNRGPGAATGKRVSWKGVHPSMSKTDASQFTVSNFIALQSSLNAISVPYQANLI
ncbi:hypothetical protein GOP47_0017835 [Adiantum capillus-veneris]|uniref:Pectinesterase n=1 Tax=Adiantum capillus-veneris TaxID=13818 RepID=A0A9D4UGK4_ADICA|nr:hypothetical protein GOP47_0017835 [Adiantum capillus-veneris]